MTYNSSNIQWTGKRNFHAKLMFSHEIRHDNAILRKKVFIATYSYHNIIFLIISSSVYFSLNSNDFNKNETIEFIVACAIHF